MGVQSYLFIQAFLNDFAIFKFTFRINIIEPKTRLGTAFPIYYETFKNRPEAVNLCLRKARRQNKQEQCDIFHIFQEFHIILLMERGKKTHWSLEETGLLVELVPKFTSKRWKKNCQQFRQRGFHRSETECREKWVNFLAPEVNRREWQAWELRTLYEMHATVGTRWCLIQKSINRSQNQIKNRFYGTLRNFIRTVLSFFDPIRQARNFPVTILSPNYLNSIYNSISQFSFLNGEVSDAIFTMGFRVDRQLLTTRIQGRQGLYGELNLLLLKDLNQPSPNTLQNCTDFNFNSPGNNLFSTTTALVNQFSLNSHSIMIPCPPPLFWYY